MTKQILTSNYARHKHDPNAYGISVPGLPRWYTGKRLKFLAPTWEIVKQYKIDDHNVGRHEAEQLYINRYFDLLLNERGLTAQSIYDQIPDQAILLCYEKPEDFCHRRLLAEFLELELGINVPEVALIPQSGFEE